MGQLRLNRPKNAKGEQRYHQGYYVLRNPDKYIGDPSNIMYRSSWERKFCTFCDINPNVIKWGSEVSAIPYIGPDGKQHKYHIDFYIETPTPNSDVYKKMLVEVKPSNECLPPKKPQKMTAKAMESYEYALKMYQKNLYKWQAAKQYAIDRGMQFVIVNENHLDKIR